MKPKSFLFAAALFVAPLAAIAHGPHIGIHGGRQTAAGAFHVEVVAKDATLVVYLADHSSREIATSGFLGVATVTADDKGEQIQLVPAGENRLTGTASAPIPAEFKGAVKITTPTGSTVLGKFD
jgi:hypothetical protein